MTNLLLSVEAGGSTSESDLEEHARGVYQRAFHPTYHKSRNQIDGCPDTNDSLSFFNFCLRPLGKDQGITCVVVVVVVVDHHLVHFFLKRNLSEKNSP